MAHPRRRLAKSGSPSFSSKESTPALDLYDPDGKKNNRKRKAEDRNSMFISSYSIFIPKNIDYKDLSFFDDVLTEGLIDNVFFPITTRKLYRERPMRNISQDAIYEILSKHLTGKGEEPKVIDLQKAVIDFVDLPSVKRFLQPFSLQSQLHFMKYSMLYMNLYSPSTGFSIDVTDRYVSRSSTKEACVISRHEFSKGQVIKGLEAWSAHIDQDDLDNFEGPDFSMINHENGTGSFLLGPARFVNHSCEPNASFKYRGRRITIVAIKHIGPGQEITVNYGNRYFGRFNRECLCLACEIRGVNGYGEPYITNEMDTSSSEDEGSEDEDEDSDCEFKKKKNHVHRGANEDDDEEEEGYEEDDDHNGKDDDIIEISPDQLNLPKKSSSKPSATSSPKLFTKTVIGLETPSPSPSPHSPISNVSVSLSPTCSKKSIKVKHDATNNKNTTNNGTLSISLPDTPVSDSNSPNTSINTSCTENSPPPHQKTQSQTQTQQTSQAQQIQQQHNHRCTRIQARMESQKKVIDFFTFQFPDDDKDFTNTHMEWEGRRIQDPELTLLDYILEKLSDLGMYVELQALYYREAIDADPDLTLDCDNCQCPFFGPDDSKPPRIFPDRFCPRCNRHAMLYNSLWPSFEREPEKMVLKHPWDFSNMKLIGVRSHFIPPEDDKKNKRSGDDENEEEYSDGSEELDEDYEDENHHHTRGRKRRDIGEHHYTRLKKRGRPPKEFKTHAKTHDFSDEENHEEYEEEDDDYENYEDPYEDVSTQSHLTRQRIANDDDSDSDESCDEKIFGSRKRSHHRRRRPIFLYPRHPFHQKLHEQRQRLHKRAKNGGYIREMPILIPVYAPGEADDEDNNDDDVLKIITFDKDSNKLVSMSGMVPIAALGKTGEECSKIIVTAAAAESAAKEAAVSAAAAAEHTKQLVTNATRALAQVTERTEFLDPLVVPQCGLETWEFECSKCRKLEYGDDDEDINNIDDSGVAGTLCADDERSRRAARRRAAAEMSAPPVQRRRQKQLQQLNETTARYTAMNDSQRRAHFREYWLDVQRMSEEYYNPNLNMKQKDVSEERITRQTSSISSLSRSTASHHNSHYGRPHRRGPRLKNLLPTPIYESKSQNLPSWVLMQKVK